MIDAHPSSNQIKRNGLFDPEKISITSTIEANGGTREPSNMTATLSNLSLNFSKKYFVDVNSTSSELHGD